MRMRCQSGQDCCYFPQYLFFAVAFLDLPNHYIVYYILVGIEARGFMFGPSIALAIGAKFVPLRKPGKLPGKW